MIAHTGNGHMRRNNDSTRSSKDLTPCRILKVTHRAAAPDRGEFDIYDCLVTNLTDLLLMLH